MATLSRIPSGSSQGASGIQQDPQMYLAARSCISKYRSFSKLTEFDEESAGDSKGVDGNGNVLCNFDCICAAAPRVMYATVQDGSAVAGCAVACPDKGLWWIQGPRLGQRAGDLAS